MSPDLWSAVVRSLPRDAAALRFLFEGWADRIEARATPGVLILLGLSVGLAIALYAGRRYLAPRLIQRDPEAQPHRMGRLLAATGVLTVGALPALAGSYLVYLVLDTTSLMVPEFERVVAALLGGLAFVAFVHALADAILAPGRASWRLVALADGPAARITNFLVGLAAIIGVGKVFEALNQAIAAALPITVATKGVFALLAALALAELLRRFAATDETEEECFGPYVPTAADIAWPVRLLGWTSVAVVTGAVLFGYIAFASFLVDQLVWIALILATLLLAIAFGDEFTTGTLGRETRVATVLQANTGLRRRSLEQIGILANGIGRIVLIIAAVMLALAPWGVDSADLVGSLRGAFFGFKVGDVTISLVDRRLRRIDFRARLCRDARRPALARHDLPARDRSRCGHAELDHAPRSAISASSSPPRSRCPISGLSLDRIAHRRRRAFGRHRLRPAVDRQQFRLRPDPSVGAADPGRRPRRGRRRRGPCPPHQRALDRDRDLRPLDPDRAELEPDLRRRPQPRAQRPDRACHHCGQRAAQPGPGARR